MFLAVSFIEGLERENEKLQRQNSNLIAMLEAERKVRVNAESLQEICRVENQTEKIKDFVAVALEGFDCSSCKKIGIDPGTCSGNCEDVILKFLEVEE
jgi:hypothetical protein